MSEESTSQDITPVASSSGQQEILSPSQRAGVSDMADRTSTGRPPLSPLTHILIFSSVLVPVALFPYLAVRRHLLSLHRKMGELGAGNAVLQRDLRNALLESSVRREEHERLRALLAETRRDVEKVKAEESRREVARATADERVRRDIQELMVERQKTRAGLSTLQDLSSSLADIAAFMHEVEVQQGFVSRKNDGRGIERIRQLAYRLQGLSVNKEPAASPSPTSDGTSQQGSDSPQKET